MHELVHNSIKDKIESVRDNSDSMVKRLRFQFKNGFALSVIQFKDNFSSANEKSGLLEIAPINQTGSLEGELLGIKCDDVTVVDPSEVFPAMKKLAEM